MLSRVACHTVACSKGGDEPLKVHLRRITETGVANFPDELLTPVIEASHDSDCRREIMNHLRECLSERSGKRCLRIFAGLVLIEKLVEQGSPALIIETAQGYHFDLIQKISLLENYDSAAQGCSNPFAQKAVREKAAKLHTQVFKQLRLASDDAPAAGSGVFKDTTSTGSFSNLSTCTGGTETSAASRRSTPSVDPRTFLESELQQITESGSVDIPTELLAPVLKVCHDPESFAVILQHLHKCFADTSPGQWRKVHAGLYLLEQIRQHGRPNVFQDADATGCSLTSTMWALQEFEHRKDWKAQGAIRKKATKLFEQAIEMQRLGAQGKAQPCKQDSFEDAFMSLRDWAEEGPDRTSWSTHPSSRPSSAALSDDSEEGLGGGLKLAGSLPPSQTFHAKAKGSSLAGLAPPGAARTTKLAL
mmetsp:Transcript_32208/g.75631  ORF Transcript_32208/g.75631 Transcript_32208/m.75631 type:complete len:419 (-) Transcript_32208:221-1477(-)|eukprot:CAMPEP_0178404140 /NCGR_PEP_ID=MMETSP0689_2-20121128/17727_1 /TAXON_ID=160604 /ORGANISM="Amphidinium massartii, Strain CS-259" /LENGTH=418 /DNA_ID=CAMNT_0020025109 /DNA_START=57 /DNA_END=1313 /DNA_ORIENTATION=+